MLGLEIFNRRDRRYHFTRKFKKTCRSCGKSSCLFFVSLWIFAFCGIDLRQIPLYGLCFSMAALHSAQKSSGFIPKPGMKAYSCISLGERVWSKSYISARIGLSFIIVLRLGYSSRSPVVVRVICTGEIRNFDDIACMRRVDELAVSHIHSGVSYVAPAARGEENYISDLKLTF